MAEFGPEIRSDVVAASQEGLTEAAEALERAFDAKFEIEVGDPGTFDADSAKIEFAEAGLMVVLSVGEAATLLILPEASGVIPAWYAEPDATGVSKLTTLAQELGMVLLPEEFMPEDFKAARVDNLSAAIDRGNLVDDAALVPFKLACGDKMATMSMIWPAASPGDVLEAAAEEPAEEESPAAAEPTPAPAAATGPPAPAGAAVGRFGDVESGLRSLPPYSRSLLKIKVPVMVNLASTKLQVNRIVELGPGSIIQFDKSCEETLSLEIGGQDVAVGEAVKVGDKFGLRITSMIMPEERFWVVRGKREA